MLKIKLGARLKLADHKAGRIFRALTKGVKGVFENDVSVAVEEWLLRKLWECLDKKRVVSFNRKVEVSEEELAP